MPHRLPPTAPLRRSAPPKWLSTTLPGCSPTCGGRWEPAISTTIAIAAAAESPRTSIGIHVATRCWRTDIKQTAQAGAAITTEFVQSATSAVLFTVGRHEATNHETTTNRTTHSAQYGRRRRSPAARHPACTSNAERLQLQDGTRHHLLSAHSEFLQYRLSAPVYYGRWLQMRTWNPSEKCRRLRWRCGQQAAVYATDAGLELGIMIRYRKNGTSWRGNGSGICSPCAVCIGSPLIRSLQE